MIKFSVVSILLLAILLIQCIASERSTKFDKTDNSKYTQGKPPQLVSIPFPNANTFFPLIPQSAWHYEQFMEGDIEPGNSQVDSVIEVTETDTGILCKMVRIENELVKEFAYLVKADSTVLLVDKVHGTKVYCSLFPTPGKKIGELTYSKYQNEDSTRIYLEIFDIETATEEQQMIWQVKIFDKDIGLISYGGNERDMSLVEYHIGNGPVVKTGK